MIDFWISLEGERQVHKLAVYELRRCTAGADEFFKGQLVCTCKMDMHSFTGKFMELKCNFPCNPFKNHREKKLHPAGLFYQDA